MPKEKSDLDRLLEDTRDLPDAERAPLANKLLKRGYLPKAEVDQARRRSR